VTKTGTFLWNVDYVSSHLTEECAKIDPLISRLYDYDYEITLEDRRKIRDFYYKINAQTSLLAGDVREYRKKKVKKTLKFWKK
jgi:hypothetical protein